MITSPQVGQIVEFAGYSLLEEGTKPVLEEGQRVKITEITKDDQDNTIYGVRPVLDNGEINKDVGGDTIFDDEFKVIVESEVAKEADSESSVEAKPEKKTKAKKKNKAAKEVDSEYDPDGPLMAAEGFEHDPLISDLIRGTNNVTELAYSLFAEHEELYFKLGGVLLDLQEKRMHKEAGYEDTAVGFAEFVKDHVGPERRHCYYLISMYKRFRKAGITAADLRGVGWTKARLLSKVEDSEIDSWLDKAKSMTRQELDDSIKKSRQHIDPETINKIRYTFTLYGDANTLVQQALDYAKQQVDGETDREVLNKAFELICSEYLILNVEQQNGEQDESDEIAAKGKE